MDERILLSHGEGGRKTHDLISKLFLRFFRSEHLSPMLDSALLPAHDGERLVFTTDGHVVDPAFFPGGDIGRLAICGTVNDLAVCGAIPYYISLGAILEEGLPLADLEKICESIAQTAEECSVEIVTGDTKVVPKGYADKLYLTTAGIGFQPRNRTFEPQQILPGDVIMISGPIGKHGAAIMAERLKLSRNDALFSDVGPVTDICQAALKTGTVRVMRDATRGGLATVLNEFAEKTNLTFVLDEAKLPVTPEVTGLCELIGVEPVYLANEGTVVMIVSPESADEILEAVKATSRGSEAALIGSISEGTRKGLLMRTAMGTHRLLTMLSGGQFPRIC